MEKDESSGIVPNIIDIRLGVISEKNNKKLIKSDGLLGNFQGVIQILGRYDVKKFVESVLKNEDKPLVLCLQFENFQSTKPRTRYITLHTTYKMCHPLHLNESGATPIDIKIVDNKIVHRDQGRMVNKKERKHYSKSTKPICGQIQNILPPCCRKSSFVISKGHTYKYREDVAKSSKTVIKQEISADNAEIELFGTRFGIKFHDPNLKAMVHKNKDNLNKRNFSILQKHGQSLMSGATDSNLKRQEVAGQVPQHLIGRDDVEAGLLDGHLGIKFNDTGMENGVKAGNRADLRPGYPPLLQDGQKNKNRRWLLEEGAEDIDWKKWGIPDNMPKDTICRCSYYFEDGQCKCHELLRKMNITSSGPVYIFHDEAANVPGWMNIDAVPTAGGRSIYYSKASENNVELNNYPNPGESGAFANKNGQRYINRTNESMSLHSNTKTRLDERSLVPQRISAEKDEGLGTTKNITDISTSPHKSTETMRSRNCYDCELGKSCCKCCKCKTGIGSPRHNKLCGMCSSVKLLSQRRASKPDGKRMFTCIPTCNQSICECELLSTKKEKTFLPSVKTSKDDCIPRCKRSICDCKTRSKMKGALYPQEGERDELSAIQTSDRGIPLDSRLGEDQLPVSEISGPGEIVVIPSTKPIEKLPVRLDGESGDLPDHFYCGCTGVWIEYNRQKTEETLAEEIEEEPPEQQDIIPGFSFMLQSCTLELDKNNIPIDKECLVRQQEIDRFNQSGYKHQPKTLIMNDPYSTPLRIYEVSPGEGKRFLSGQIQGKS